MKYLWVPALLAAASLMLRKKSSVKLGPVVRVVDNFEEEGSGFRRVPRSEIPDVMLDRAPDHLSDPMGRATIRRHDGCEYAFLVEPHSNAAKGVSILRRC